MLKMLAAGLFSLCLAMPAWPQDQPADPAPADENDATAEEDTPDEAEEAESDGTGPAVGLDTNPELDQQTYEKDDDEFIPTEEIPVDQSIPFPTDI